MPNDVIAPTVQSQHLSPHVQSVDCRLASTWSRTSRSKCRMEPAEGWTLTWPNLTKPTSFTWKAIKRCCLNTVPKYCLYGHTWRQYKLKQNDSKWQCGSQSCQICHTQLSICIALYWMLQTASPLDSFEVTWPICLSIVGRANCVCLILMRGQFEGNSVFGVRSLDGQNKIKRCFCLLCLAFLLTFFRRH